MISYTPEYIRVLLEGYSSYAFSGNLDSIETKADIDMAVSLLSATRRRVVTRLMMGYDVNSKVLDGAIEAMATILHDEEIE